MLPEKVTGRELQLGVAGMSCWHDLLACFWLAGVVGKEDWNVLLKYEIVIGYKKEKGWLVKKRAFGKGCSKKKTVENSRNMLPEQVVAKIGWR